MEKILITGGAGFIGSHLADRLIQEGYSIIVVDNLSSGRKENINRAATFYPVDITSAKLSEVFEAEKPNTVFHFAAHIEARVSVQDPITDARTNILGSLNVLEQSRKHGVEKILFASSGGEIYGPTKKIPTPENHPPGPLSPYGVSKLAVEQYLEAYQRLFGLPYTALRYGNVYGPRQNPNGEAGVVAIFANRMLEDDPVFIHGDGKQTKDYIFIDDAIEASLRAFKKDFTGVVNIATGKETSVLHIFESIKKLTRSRAKEKYVPLPAGGFKRGILSITKAKKELAWHPEYSFQKGLETTIQWFQQNKLQQ